MGRCRQSDNGSFDLLLDTMCNMFGGMVLIAILLAILSQASSKVKPDDTEGADAAIDIATAAQQKAEIVQLNELITQREQRLKQTTNVVINATRNDVEGFRRHLSELKRENDTLGKALISHKSASKQSEGMLAQLNTELERVKTQIELQETVFEKRTMRMATLRATIKQPVFFAVKKGLLCAISDISVKQDLYSKRGYNTSSVEVNREPGGLDIVEVRPETGQELGDGSLPGKVGKQVLENVHSATEFISFAVFPDSYGEFNRVKEFFASRGYEFNWTPMVEDQTIRIVPAKRIETQ